MYFLSVVLLLFVSKFGSTQSQGISENNDWFPFEYEYTDETTQFLMKITSMFKIFEKIKVESIVRDLASVLHKMNLEVSNDKCDAEEISSSPLPYRPSTEGLQNCKRNCYAKNKRYVIFLNEYTSRLKKYLLGEQPVFNIYLNTIKSGVYACIQQPNMKIFICNCDTNYQIMINRNLETLVNNVSKIPNAGQKINDFVAFVILLKFYPYSAPFYGSWLFIKYELPSIILQSENSNTGHESSSSNLTDMENTDYILKDIENQLLEKDDGFTEGGVIQQRRFRKNDEKLFYVIFNLVQASCKNYCSSISNDNDFNYWCNTYSIIINHVMQFVLRKY